jgi:anti-anti-sigma regulatory factor
MVRQSSLFTVHETDERIIVRFRDWSSSAESFRRTASHVFAADARDQLRDIISQAQGKRLAIDMKPVASPPTALLGILIAASKNGVDLELLHPSPSTREVIEIFGLGRFFMICDQLTETSVSHG